MRLARAERAEWGGQVYYDASRKLILRGVDGVVFVADSQAARYDAKVKIRIEIINSLGETEGRVEAVAQRTRSVPEGITLVEREQIWFELTEQVMRELDVELERTIRQYLGNYIR